MSQKELTSCWYPAKWQRPLPGVVFLSSPKIGVRPKKRIAGSWNWAFRGRQQTAGQIWHFSGDHQMFWINYLVQNVFFFTESAAEHSKYTKNSHRIQLESVSGYLRPVNNSRERAQNHMHHHWATCARFYHHVSDNDESHALPPLRPENLFVYCHHLIPQTARCD